MIRVKAAFFSLTPAAPPADTRAYLRWHLLDHMPEQYQLPGIVHAMRWIADDGCRESRIFANGHLDRLGSVVNYLVGDPVQRTHDDFCELGLRLAELGRFPERRESLELRMLALQRWYAAPRALVSAEVVPFRPHRGIPLIMEEPSGDDVSGWLRWLHTEHYPAVLDVGGVAGVWMYSSSDAWTLDPSCQGDPVYTTVVYLDADPLATTRALTSMIEARWTSGAVRPQFAGPLQTMVQWDAWPV